MIYKPATEYTTHTVRRDLTDISEKTKALPVSNGVVLKTTFNQ